MQMQHADLEKVGVQYRVTVPGATVGFYVDKGLSSRAESWRIGHRLARHGRPGIPFLLWPWCAPLPPKKAVFPQETHGYWQSVAFREPERGIELGHETGRIRVHVLDVKLPLGTCDFGFVDSASPARLENYKGLWLLDAGEIERENQREAALHDRQLGAYSSLLRGTNYRLNRWYAGLYTWALYLRGNYVHDTDQNGIVDAAHGYQFRIGGIDVSSIGWQGRMDGIRDYRWLLAAEEVPEAANHLDDLRHMVPRHIPEARGYFWDVPDTWDPMPGFNFNVMRLRLAEFIIGEPLA